MQYGSTTEKSMTEYCERYIRISAFISNDLIAINHSSILVKHARYSHTVASYIHLIDRLQKECRAAVEGKK